MFKGIVQLLDIIVLFQKVKQEDANLLKEVQVVYYQGIPESRPLNHEFLSIEFGNICWWMGFKEPVAVFLTPSLCA